MKSKLLVFVSLFILVFGCKKDDQNFLQDKLLGIWVNTQVDQQDVLTDHAFAMIFQPDMVQVYANGFILNDSNKTWIENSNYTFSVQDSNLTIDGSDTAGNVFHMVFRIKSLDDHTLNYTVSEFRMNGVYYPDPKIYTHKRVSVDLKEEFIGTWYGRSTTPGTSDTTHHYWDYHADGQFDYYYRDDEGLWTRKPDNEGRYFLYGDFLATNFTNDLLSGSAGKAYECWNISIEGTVMNWSGLREDGLTTSFGLTKVDGPPAAGSPKQKY